MFSLDIIKSKSIFFKIQNGNFPKIEFCMKAGILGNSRLIFRNGN